MSILDDTRALLAGQKDKLQAERERLVGERDKITASIAEIDAFLKQMGGAEPRAPRTPSATGRRSGIRDDVLKVITDKGTATTADVRSALGIADGDKSGSQSVSNALSALKKAGKLTTDASGAYKAA